MKRCLLLSMRNSGSAREPRCRPVRKLKEQRARIAAWSNNATGKISKRSAYM